MWTGRRAINMARSASNLALLSVLLAAKPMPRKSLAQRNYLYLLAGTPTPYSSSGFPVRLYAVTNGQPTLERQVASSLFSVADDLNGHLYVLPLGQNELHVIHEATPAADDVVAGRESFYWQTWGAIAGSGVAPGIVYANIFDGSHWTVTRILADSRPGTVRVQPGSLELYRSFRYAGPGALTWPNLTAPGGFIRGGHVLMPYTLRPSEGGDLGPLPPFLPAGAGAVPGYPYRPHGAGVLADTQRFFLIEVDGKRYLLDKTSGRWTTLTLPPTKLPLRVFGPWVAVVVQRPNPRGFSSPGVENERPRELDNGPNRELPQVRGQYSAELYMPGELVLHNMTDGRQVTITTGQQDSQVIAVDAAGTVIYRVNDQIDSVRIKGTKLGPATLLVHGADVPEVHWAFWSTASPQPKQKPD